MAVVTARRSDEELAQEAALGGREAFDVIVHRYAGPLFTFCRHLTRNSAEAEDRAQEAFVKAYRKLETYDASRPFSSWLFKIAQNACYDGRKHREEVIPALEAEPREGPKPLASDRVDRLEAAVAELPVKYRAVLHHKYGRGLNAAEIARELELSPEDVRVCLHRAIRLLRESVGP